MRPFAGRHPIPLRRASPAGAATGRPPAGTCYCRIWAGGATPPLPGSARLSAKTDEKSPRSGAVYGATLLPGKTRHSFQLAACGGVDAARRFVWCKGRADQPRLPLMREVARQDEVLARRKERCRRSLDLPRRGGHGPPAGRDWTPSPRQRSPLRDSAARFRSGSDTPAPRGCTPGPAG